MTKRYGNFEQQNNKKPKLEDDVDALWGDDLDEDAIDDCIKLATQVYQEDKITCTQLNNVTLLPTYSAFKARNSIFHSTQFDKSVRASTSKNEPFPKGRVAQENVQHEIKSLREQYEEREGEVSILKSQLQETRARIQTEQQKMRIEWKEKINLTEKQMKSVKSELEFKNLEIANLKQKISDIMKHNKNLTMNTTQNVITQKNKKVSKSGYEKIKPKLLKIQAIVNPIYPLRDFIPESIFNVAKQEQYVIQTKLTHHACRNSIPYLQNQKVLATITIDKSEKNIDYVYPEIVKFMYCTAEELDLKENIVLLNKIICSCEQFLDDLQAFLEQIKANLNTEDILKADFNYLKYENSDEEEIGVKSSVLLNFLADIFPYSDYLKGHICQNKPLLFQEQETCLKKFPYLTRMRYKPHYFLNTLLSIIKTAGEIRKTNLMTRFLCSSVKLLTNICKSRNYDYVNNIFCKLTKEIILSRPTFEVLCQLTCLFKVASQYSSFVEFLLNKTQNCISNKRGLLFFNEGACPFYIFVMLFDRSIFNIKNDRLSIDVYFNVLCFMYNTFKSAHWIHHRDRKECECVAQLYKLLIGMVFKALEKYKREIKEMRRAKSEWGHFFKNTIVSKVLSLMTFNSLALTEKYITAFAQYKEIEKRLQEEGLMELEKWNTNEEIIEISSNAFANLHF